MLSEEVKATLLSELNNNVGADVTDLSRALSIEGELVIRRNKLQSKLNLATDLAPSKLSAAVRKAERSSKRVETLRIKTEEFKSKVDQYLTKTKPITEELSKQFAAIQRLEEVLSYLKSLEKVEELNRQLTACNDDDQAVQLYGQLQTLCATYTEGHRAAHVAETARHWHHVLKERLSKITKCLLNTILKDMCMDRQYEDILKALKWPRTSGQEPSPPPREIVTRFNNLTKYLFLIQEPKAAPTPASVDTECEPSLPVRLLLRPLRKRFAFHFTGSRQTARADRPEWFLTQTLTWIKEHAPFIRANVQPVAEKLRIDGVRAEDEFVAGLVSLAAERLHTVFGLYGARGKDIVDVDAAFAHAVDEALGFHRELAGVLGRETGAVLSVLTKAEHFVWWLEVEKKYALAKMEETLSSEQWMEGVGVGAEGEAELGAPLWVPRGADWFVALLKTIEDRYTALPQPGHRLQFLELQLELIEEWRVRLTQLMSASCGSLLAPGAAPHPLTAAVNAAHHTRAALLQWAHSLHYLQLHFYRQQFQHFTELQHAGEVDAAPPADTQLLPVADSLVESDKEEENQLSLVEVEMRAKKMALNEVERRDSLPPPPAPQEPVGSSAELEESGVFGELPGLLAHLRDAGLTTLSDHMLLEFKAGLRDYKKQKWHAMSIMEERALSVSRALCEPLAGLCAQLQCARARLAPTLCAKLRAHVAASLDIYLFEEVVLESWWNSGGTAQFTHDVKRNLVPVFAPPGKPAAHNLPRLTEACIILNMDYEDAHQLRLAIAKTFPTCNDSLPELGVRNLLPQEVLQILNQRTDLNGNRSGRPHRAVMDYF